MENNSAKSVYRVLARKYRPVNFNDLIGQEPMVRTLTNAFHVGRIAQAWMLTGVRGVGKTTTARILARALNFKSDEVDRPTIDLTSLGEHCQAIMEGRHVDVVEMDAASHTGIDDVREIIEQVRYRPVSARYKIYIIDEVHMLSTQAFNGLLKTLEEPPSHVKFIFATTEIRKVPITVLSRCQRFDLRRIETGALVQHLRKIVEAEHVFAEDGALAMIARAGEGSVRDALSILDQAIAYGEGRIEAKAIGEMLGLADRSRIIDLFELLMKGEVAAALNEFRNQYNQGANPVVLLNELADFNHMVTRLRFTPGLAEDLSISEDERVRGSQFAQTIALSTLSRNWQMLLKGIKEVESSARPVQAAEMLLIRLAHAVEIPSLEDILKDWQKKNLIDEPRDRHQPTHQQMRADGDLSRSGISALEFNEKQFSGEVGYQGLSASRASTSANHEDRAVPVDSYSNTRVSYPKNVDAHHQKSNQPVAVTQDLDPVPSAFGNVEISDKAVPLDRHRKHAVDDAALNITGEYQFDQTPENIVETGRNTQESLVIATFNDLVRIADEKRELEIKLLVKEFVRPIAFEHGHIKFELAPGAPRDFVPQLAKILRDWTGQRWLIDVAAMGGGKTITEQEEDARQILRLKAEADPDVQAVLAKFPGAKIVDVRLKQDDSAAFTDDDNDLMLPPTYSEHDED